ncbi:hypothetical protein [uncultured Chryseobacterium sp.]|uniref:hypothetical protein n=1 Tax=uncultured Chryseobacterium sp. TaxID=259322 RepID=UPI0025831710|nr:hypothetical protein [uncultured Chryseobacterium sp.]
MKNKVFNNKIGNPYSLTNKQLTKDEELKVASEIFEQLLIFDQIIISTNMTNFSLFVLIKNLGINTVEKLIEYDYIKFMIWSPLLITSTGRRLDDGTIDESRIYELPPLTGGSYTELDLDPDKNIEQALRFFSIPRERKRAFMRKARKNYINIAGMELSTQSAKVAIDSYTNNNLVDLGLPFEKEPNKLNITERATLQKLGHKIIETAVISQYNLKSYDNYEHIAIVKNNFENIGKAYNIVDNSNSLFKLENLPNLKELFISEKLNFDDVFKIRNLSSARYYRKWINDVGESHDSLEVTREYLNEIKGNNSFFESVEGKLIRNVGLFTASTTIGAVLAGPVGLALGFTLGLLETYWLGNILKERNPSMFIDYLKFETERKRYE